MLEQELGSIKANGIEMASRPAQPAKTGDQKEASSNSSKAPAAEKKISGAVKETKQAAQQGELWEALLARMRKNAMPVYMTLKSAEGGRRQDNAYIVMFSPEHESKMKFINGKTEAISKELEALTGEKLAVRTEQTVPAQKQEEQDELIANIIDIFGEENIHFKRFGGMNYGKRRFWRLWRRQYAAAYAAGTEDAAGYGESAAGIRRNAD